MRLKSVFHMLSLLAGLAGVLLLIPCICSLIYGEPAWRVFGETALASVIAAGVLFVSTRGNFVFRIRECYALVVLGWIVFSCIGAFPYLLFEFHFSQGVFSFSDAFFESVSGFTTTGSSILTDISALPKGLLFWRSFTQWLGGMGMVVLFIAVLPQISTGAVSLYKAEIPGPDKDKLAPRIQDTAKFLWWVYLFISVFLFTLLVSGKMNVFDALCHTFSTVSTGGFSTQNASIGGFHSLYLEMVVVAFMFIAGANFGLHFLLFFKGRLKQYIGNREFTYYLAGVFLVVLLVTASLFFQKKLPLEKSLRLATFQVVSIVTTTGFGTGDFLQWPAFPVAILFFLMFLGGCGGSTAGGIKIVRVAIALKFGFREVKKILNPQTVFKIRLGNVPINEGVLAQIRGFLVLFVVIFLVAVLWLALLGVDLVTAAGAAASALGNIGPGLGTVGPAANYHHLPELAKWILISCMLLGRLEIYTLALVLLPDFWKKF